MLVSRDKLSQYNIPTDYYFNSRNGTTNEARNYYFSQHPELLLSGIHCAVGNDTDGWELELFNGANWVIVNPSPNYLLTITNEGLAALNNISSGGIKLVVSGIKIISEIVVPNPAVPLVSWTDTELFTAGNGKFAFTCGTRGSIHDDLSSILSWRFNSSAGSLQYILTLPPTGTGSTDDYENETWKIGTIGIYVKSPYNNTDDILFGIGRLTDPITKTCTTVSGPGNTVKIYLNTTLSNLGYIADLAVLPSEEQNIPEVPNESFLENPMDITQQMYNCYLVDNYNGTGVPALAVPRVNKDHTITTTPTWAYFQPTDNAIQVDASLFASNVGNYMFVYWDTTSEHYELAEGSTEEDPRHENQKLPCGLRVGNSITFSGNIFNDSTSYTYTTEVQDAGRNYEVGDELVLLLTAYGVSDLTFKVKVTAVNDNGSITSIKFYGPTTGNISIGGTGTSGDLQVDNVPSEYSPYSQLPHNGYSATFMIRQTAIARTNWNFSPSAYNLPVYCGSGADAGMPVTYKTDSFVGWCTGANSIQLNLDLRKEATEDQFGTTRYATDDQVRNVTKSDYNLIKNQRAVTPEALQKNFFQITKPQVADQAGYDMRHPVEVEAFTHFKEVVLGRGTTSPYDSTTANPQVNNTNISFYGLAYAAWFQDIAELYESDAHYDAGTLVCIGQGQKEMTIATTEANGIISDKPGFILGKQTSKNQLPVALTGRTPVIFDGKCIINYGDKIYLSKVVPGTASTIKNGPCLGKVIEKNFGSKRKIECIVKLAFE